jgi:hypothetical protein
MLGLLVIVTVAIVIGIVVSINSAVDNARRRNFPSLTQEAEIMRSLTRMGIRPVQGWGGLSEHEEHEARVSRDLKATWSACISQGPVNDGSVAGEAAATSLRRTCWANQGVR